MTDTPTEREAEGMLTRLRRRKVVQWRLVFGAAAAWGFVQGLGYVTGTYDWPRQIQQLTTLAPPDGPARVASRSAGLNGLPFSSPSGASGASMGSNRVRRPA